MSKQSNTYHHFGSKKKLLALDVGSFFIGTALSDQDQKVAFPGAIIEWRGDMEKLRSAFDTLFQEENIEKVIVGYSLLLGGQDPKSSGGNERALEAYTAVTELLKTEYDVEVVPIDERVSTQEAENRMSEVITDPVELRKTRKDSVAAQIILERYLEQ